MGKKWILLPTRRLRAGKEKCKLIDKLSKIEKDISKFCEHKYSVFFSDKGFQENALILEDKTYEHCYMLK